MSLLEERDSIKKGTVFQVSMMFLFVLTLLLYGLQDQYSHWFWLSFVGQFLFFYCLLRIYNTKGQKSKALLTTGPFKYTRHPMYTGILIMDMGFWLPNRVSSESLFFILQLAFITCLIIAAYFQEKETLARFGQEAKTYYAKTPRLFFLYPFIRQ